MSIGYDEIRAQIPRYREVLNLTLGGFLSVLRSGAMNLAPDYQRGHVWTVEQSQAFMGHLLEGGATPAFILHEDRRGDWGYEMVDGQQRARAILAWFDGEIGARLTDKSLVWHKDADEREQRLISMGITVQANFGEWSRQERLRLYLRLNRGGTVHSEDEIERVRAMMEDEAA